tara:strand:- start:264 stop:518 length:255 start_codon:yes stop_codon:yes gene_type:complete
MTLKTLFEFHPSERLIVEDDMFVLLKNRAITIQVCQDKTFVVSVWHEAKFMIEEIATTRSLDRAMRIAATHKVTPLIEEEGCVL